MHKAMQKAPSSTLLRLVIFVLSLAGAQSLSAQKPVLDATHDIVEAREQVADLVRDIKGKFKESAPEWRGARDRYRKAYAEYNAYILTVKAAIRQGKTDNLAKDPAYKKNAEEASNSAKAFIEYAQSKTTGPTRSVFLIAALFSQGINVINAYRSFRADQRMQEAEAFEKDVKWLRWEEIK